jgi:DNA-binding NarL/FixJ family response regulator
MQSSRPLRIVIGDLPGIARTALTTLIDDAPGLAVVGLAASLVELADKAAAVRADVVLLDDRLLRGALPSPGAFRARLVITGVDDAPAYAQRARRLGASQWVRKDLADELLAALHAEARGLTRAA